MQWDKIVALLAALNVFHGQYILVLSEFLACHEMKYITYAKGQQFFSIFEQAAFYWNPASDIWS